MVATQPTRPERLRRPGRIRAQGGREGRLDAAGRAGPVHAPSHQGALLSAYCRPRSLHLASVDMPTPRLLHLRLRASTPTPPTAYRLLPAHTQSDVLRDEIPEKEETLLPVELTPAQKALYRGLLEKNAAQVGLAPSPSCWALLLDDRASHPPSLSHGGSSPRSRARATGSSVARAAPPPMPPHLSRRSS